VHRGRLARLGRAHRHGSAENEGRQEVERTSDFLEGHDPTGRSRLAHRLLGLGERLSDAREPEHPRRRSDGVHASDEANGALGVGGCLLGRMERDPQGVEPAR
jgi:hypothetical protein